MSDDKRLAFALSVIDDLILAGIRGGIALQEHLERRRILKRSIDKALPIDGDAQAALTAQINAKVAFLRALPAEPTEEERADAVAAVAFRDAHLAATGANFPVEANRVQLPEPSLASVLAATGGEFLIDGKTIVVVTDDVVSEPIVTDDVVSEPIVTDDVEAAAEATPTTVWTQVDADDV